MTLRIRGLDAIDPLHVPLPNGTEVTTRVDRKLGDRLVPQGAAGRVVSTTGDEVEVLLVGVGSARYARSEVVPRKSGQLRFARRRAAAWDALRPCRVLEATVGSRAWGLDDETSDLDSRGMFVLPFPWTTGLADPPLDLVSLDGSATDWEIGKALRQALAADPNTLELLFVDGVRATDEMGEWVLADRDAFPSAAIHGSFARYAISQLRKLEQSQRLAAHRARVLEWLRADGDATLDDVASRLASEVADLSARGDPLLRAKEYVKQLYRSLHDQGLLAACDFRSLVAFARDGADDFDLPRELRPKNAYNLLRLVGLAVEWLRTGRASLRVQEPLRGRLLAIKRGEVPLDDVLREAESMTEALEDARRSSPLPATADVARADRLLRRIREEAARRWFARAPGPFGLDAPAPPEPAFEETR